MEAFSRTRGVASVWSGGVGLVRGMKRGIPDPPSVISDSASQRWFARLVERSAPVPGHGQLEDRKRFTRSLASLHDRLSCSGHTLSGGSDLPLDGEQ